MDDPLRSKYLPFSGKSPAVDQRETKTNQSLKNSVENLERQMIREAMEETAGHQSKAASILRIIERKLRYKLKKYDIK